MQPELILSALSNEGSFTSDNGSRFVLRQIAQVLWILCAAFEFSFVSSFDVLAQGNHGAPAEIVLLAGKGEKKLREGDRWEGAAVSDKIRGGGYVQTLANSQMGLLLPDRSQIRLNQNSQLQIKSIDESSQWTQTTVRLNAGRAWSQARPMAAPIVGPRSAERVTMETPSATLSIRGTDWEVEVRPDGSAQVVVLSGVVEMSNPAGTLRLDAGGAALVFPGKAPTRFDVIRPASRVQWISAWEAQPRRWLVDSAFEPDVLAMIDAGDYSSARQRLGQAASIGIPDAVAVMADLMLAQGEVDNAIALLAAHQVGDAAPELAALMARAVLLRDGVIAAGAALVARMPALPDHPEIFLAQGDLARLEGEVKVARQAYRRVLDLKPGNPRALYGLAVIELERENYAAARSGLEQAVAAAPGWLDPRIEIGHLETMAGRLEVGYSHLQAVLREAPDNYLALTALGVNRLRSGDVAAAIKYLMSAEMIEPRYARTLVYLGVAFYQLLDQARAMQLFDRAERLDPNDPLPALMRGIVMQDDLKYGEAIDAARLARERIPYLKSLNPVVVDQRGQGSIGSALAAFGLEDWAGWYAQSAYSPFSAGGHLFMADRLGGRFGKDSELLLGFLTDPTVFGASNRQSRLVPSPGHYGSMSYLFQRDIWRLHSAQLALNGLLTSPFPMAYSALVEVPRLQGGDGPSDLDGVSGVLGLGAMPRQDLGLFAYHTQWQADGRLGGVNFIGSDSRYVERRTDVGVNFKVDAQHQFWLKAGSGRQTMGMSGTVNTPAAVIPLNEEFGIEFYDGRGILQEYKAETEHRDAQFRQSLGIDQGVISWGMEYARQETMGTMTTVMLPKAEFEALLPLYTHSALAQQTQATTRDVYVSGIRRGFWHPDLNLALGLWWQRGKLLLNESAATEKRYRGFVLDPFSDISGDVESYDKWLPRGGVQWQWGDAATLTGVVQHWRRPASTSSIGGTTDFGVAINDMLVQVGGDYRRARLQFDIAQSSQTFFQGFVDHERIDNGLLGVPSVVPKIEIDALDNLRTRRDVFSPVREFEDRPVFPSGEIGTLGVSANMRLGNRHALAFRYRNRYAVQTEDGLKIPYIPRQYGFLGSYWTLPGRLVMGVTGTFRSQRYQDAANLDKLTAGWSFGAMGYWESVDKRYSVQTVIDNILPDKHAGVYKKPFIGLQATIRF